MYGVEPVPRETLTGYPSVGLLQPSDILARLYHGIRGASEGERRQIREKAQKVLELIDEAVDNLSVTFRLGGRRVAVSIVVLQSVVASFLALAGPAPALTPLAEGKRA
jgi:hypothetical protein